MGNDDQKVHGTAPILEEKEVSRASITVKRSLDDVQSAWRNSGLPGTAVITPAPGDKGVEIRVALADGADPSGAQALDSYKGHTISGKLKMALRTIKAELETGEAPTVDGQPSGRDS